MTDWGSVKVSTRTRDEWGRWLVTGRWSSGHVHRSNKKKGSSDLSWCLSPKETFYPLGSFFPLLRSYRLTPLSVL